MRNLVLAAAVIGAAGCARPEPEPPGPWLARIPPASYVRIEPEPSYAGTAVIGHKIAGGELHELPAGSQWLCAGDKGPEGEKGRIVSVWAISPKEGAYWVERWQVRYDPASPSGGGSSGSGRGPRP